MGEFELIRRYFFPIAEVGNASSVLLGPGDDCAIQRVEPGLDLVFSVDALVEEILKQTERKPFAWNTSQVFFHLGNFPLKCVFLFDKSFIINRPERTISTQPHAPIEV